MTLQCNIPIARIGKLRYSIKKSPRQDNHIFEYFVEFLDEMQVRACNQFSKLSLAETPTLFLEFHGSESATVEQAKEVGESHKITPLYFMQRLDDEVL